MQTEHINIMASEKKERIFISYKRVDKERVFAIKDGIEQATGEKCWIDLDGIESDAQFADVIISAINHCEVFLFMYSATHAEIVNNKKDWTIREISFAEKKDKRIVFINIDNTPLTDWFELNFGTVQQVDATDAEKLKRLYKDLCSWLKTDLNTSVEVAKVGKNSFRRVIDTITPHTPSKQWLWIILVAVAMLLIGGGAYLAKKKSTTTTPTTATTTTQTQTQDSLARALQAEADRLAQERAQLEADKIKLQQSKPTVTAQPKPTTTTTQTSTSNPNTSTGQTSTTIPTTQAKPTTTSTPNKANAVAIHNGHKYVDLGLSVMWATTNIGASSPYLEGKYFAWGEVNAKQEYTWNTYRHCVTGPYDFTKYCKKTNAYNGDFIDNKSRLELADDAANVHWGGEWRMPTATEMKELVQKCKWQCVTRNGVKGQLGTGPNGNTIFLPITGMYSGANKMSAGYQGAYWSSTLDEPFIKYAIHMYVNEIQPNTAEKERYVGANIRPVLSREAIDDLSNY